MTREGFICYLIANGFKKIRRLYVHGNTNVFPLKKGFDVIIYRNGINQEKRFYYYPESMEICRGFWAMMGKKHFKKKQ